MSPGLRVEWFSAGMRAASAHGRPVRAGAILPGRSRSAEVGARLRSAHGRCLRSVRRRPHGAQDELQQVPPAVRRGPGCRLLTDRDHQRAPQLVRLRCSMRPARRAPAPPRPPTATASRRIIEIGPSPSRWHIRHRPQQHARRSRTAVQLGVHRGRSSIN